jgi:RimJ/RimL family protein N-acetyltransferase
MLTIIPFSPRYFSTLSSWFASEEDVVQWGGPLVHYPLDDPQMQAMLDAGQTDPPERLCWMAVDGEEPAGHAQLAFDWQNGNARLGRVAINPKLRGQGLAVPMLQLVIRKAFSYPEIARLELRVYSFNQPAIHTYERLGFVPEGVRREGPLVNGVRWDVEAMTLSRTGPARVKPEDA